MSVTMEVWSTEIRTFTLFCERSFYYCCSTCVS